MHSPRADLFLGENLVASCARLGLAAPRAGVGLRSLCSVWTQASLSQQFWSHLHKAPSTWSVPPDAPQRRGDKGLSPNLAQATTLMGFAGHRARLASPEATFAMLEQAGSCEFLPLVPGLLQHHPPIPASPRMELAAQVKGIWKGVPVTRMAWSEAPLPSNKHSSPSLPSPVHPVVSGLSITGRNPTGSQHCPPHRTEPAAWPEGAAPSLPRPRTGLPARARQPATRAAQKPTRQRKCESSQAPMSHARL